MTTGKSLAEFPLHLLDVLGDLYSDVKALTPSAARTAQDSLLEVRVSVEELYATARATKTDSRIPVATALRKLAARCIVEAAQLCARDEFEVKRWADMDALAKQEDIKLLPIRNNKKKKPAAA